MIWSFVAIGICIIFIAVNIIRFCTDDSWQIAASVLILLWTLILLWNLNSLIDQKTANATLNLEVVVNGETYECTRSDEGTICRGD